MYKYEDLKDNIFSDEGQRGFIKMRDHVSALLDKAGAFSMFKAMTGPVTGDSWKIMSYVDRLVELREIREITDSNVLGQDRVFVSARR